MEPEFIIVERHGAIAKVIINNPPMNIINVDLTLICERPKIKPHRQAMRERVADILGLPVDRVSIKATTTEKMGFTGREEGLAAQAIASVDMPL